MATKMFKIGEYAIGGIVKVTINEPEIKVECLSWGSRRVVASETVSDINDLTAYLEVEVTTHYYAQKIVDWVKSKL